VCNFEVGEYLGLRKIEKVNGINKGGSVELHGIRVTMLHAVHTSSIREGDSFFPGGEACGFLIQFEDGTRVYHTGDTAVHSDMKLYGDIYKPDIAVLPIGDLFTMAPPEAAIAAKMTKRCSTFQAGSNAAPMNRAATRACASGVAARAALATTVTALTSTHLSYHGPG